MLEIVWAAMRLLKLLFPAGSQETALQIRNKLESAMENPESGSSMVFFWEKVGSLPEFLSPMNGNWLRTGVSHKIFRFNQKQKAEVSNQKALFLKTGSWRSGF